MFKTIATRVFARAQGIGLALALTLVALPAVAGEWNVSGRVVYPDGQPAASATVKVLTASGQLATAVTDGSGAYAISVTDPDASEAVAWAEKGGFSSPTSNLLEKDITSNFVLTVGP